MNPRELTSLFGEKKQTLLIATEPKRLRELSEEELVDLHRLIRKGRNKYSKLHRRQARLTVAEVGRRSATQSQNLRTLRKAEIFEDALSRVSRALSAAARASANELKAERLAMAGAQSETPVPAKPAARAVRHTGVSKGASAQPTAARGGRSTPSRAASSQAQGARRQGKRDSR